MWARSVTNTELIYYVIYNKGHEHTNLLMKTSPYNYDVSVLYSVCAFQLDVVRMDLSQ